MRKHLIWILVPVVMMTACAHAPWHAKQTEQTEETEMSKPEIITVSGKIIDITCAVKGKAMMGTWDNVANDHIMADGSVTKGCAEFCLLGGLPAGLFQDDKITAILACNPVTTLASYAGQDVELQGFWATAAETEGTASFVPQQIRTDASSDWANVLCEPLHE